MGHIHGVAKESGTTLRLNSRQQADPDLPQALVQHPELRSPGDPRGARRLGKRVNLGRSPYQEEEAPTRKR